MKIGSKKNPVRISYPHLTEPKAFQEGLPKKYSVQALISKEDTETVDAIKAEITAIHKANIGTLGANFKALKVCLRDGDKDPSLSDKPECAGHWVFTASNSADNPPELYEIKDGKLEEVTSGKTIYGGCWGVLSVRVYGYWTTGKGISASLDGVLKVKDGDPFGSAVDVKSDFADELSDLEDGDAADDNW